MTGEEAIKHLEESQRQNRIMRESPTTFFKSSDICEGVKNAERRIEALDMAIAALRAQQPNAPLTLKELREMDGEPVWVKFPKCPEANGWMLVDVNRHCVYNGLLGDCDFENCGKTWLAYRRKPEEGENA